MSQREDVQRECRSDLRPVTVGISQSVAGQLKAFAVAKAWPQNRIVQEALTEFFRGRVAKMGESEKAAFDAVAKNLIDSPLRRRCG